MPFKKTCILVDSRDPEKALFSLLIKEPGYQTNLQTGFLILFSRPWRLQNPDLELHKLELLYHRHAFLRRFQDLQHSPYMHGTT